MVLKYHPDIIAINETRLTDSIDNKVITIADYKIIRNDRCLIHVDNSKDVKGGGILYYVLASLSVTDITKSKIMNMGEIEFVHLLIETSNNEKVFLPTFIGHQMVIL